jgi:hypothetical protein
MANPIYIAKTGGSSTDVQRESIGTLDKGKQYAQKKRYKQAKMDNRDVDPKTSNIKATDGS